MREKAITGGNAAQNAGGLSYCLWYPKPLEKVVRLGWLVLAMTACRKWPAWSGLSTAIATSPPGSRQVLYTLRRK